jgi:type II secretory pathway pseudopilin PulG
MRQGARVPRAVATPWGSLTGAPDIGPEGGFTLVELLIVILVLPLVIGAIGFALVSVLSLQSGVSNRISGSADAQVVSATFVNDVQSASFLTTESTSSPQCAPASQVSNSAQVLGVQSSDGQTVISYEEVPSGSIYGLFRYECQSGNLVSTNVVSNNVPSGLQATISCETTITAECNSVSPAVPPYATGWAAAAGISAITFNIVETAGIDIFHYSLTAVPRIWTTASRNVTDVGGYLPLLLLGAGSSALSCSGNGALNVSGEAVLNSTANGSVSLSGNAQLTTLQIYTADSIPSGAISASANATYTPPGSPISGPAYANPYSGLTPPSATGLNTYSDGAYHGPGIYTATLAISGKTTQAFASGIYILQNGINISGNAGISSAAGGVLFYVTGGSVSISGNGGFNLGPLSSPPSPTSGLVIWQAAGDTNALTLSGNGSGDAVSGTIYAPGAQVGGSGNGNLVAGSVLAKSLACNGNGTITLGEVPTVTGLSPTGQGRTGAGTTVTITGTGFVSGATVSFGTNAATGVTVNSSTLITAVSPAGSTGVINVTVTTPGGTSATSSADQFTYG